MLTDHQPTPAQLAHHERHGVPPKLMTYGEAAEVLGVCERTVFALVKDGSLPHVQLRAPKIIRQKRRGKVIEIVRGGAVRIDPRDLDAFIQRSKAGEANQ